jgi:hypothetical protein
MAYVQYHSLDSCVLSCVLDATITTGNIIICSLLDLDSSHTPFALTNLEWNRVLRNMFVHWTLETP